MNKKVLLHECKRHTACRVVNTPSVVLTGYPSPLLTWPGGVPYLGTPPSQGTPWPGYPPARVPPSRVPPSQGTPQLDLAGYPPGCPMAFWEMLQSIMGYGYSPPRCPMAFWEMLQSIMGYGIRSVFEGTSITITLSIHYKSTSFFSVVSTRLLLELDCLCWSNIVTEDILGHKILLPRTSLATSKLLLSTFTATNKFNLLPQKYSATTCLLPRKF